MTVQKTSLILITLLAAIGMLHSAPGNESEKGEENLEKFIASIRLAFESHKPDGIRRLSHPSVSPEIINTRIEVIRGAIDLPFDQYTTKRTTLDKIPVERPSALPDGRELKFLVEPDGVIQLKVRKGVGESALEFTFYFPYKKLESRFYLCPTGLK